MSKRRRSRRSKLAEQLRRLNQYLAKLSVVRWTWSDRFLLLYAIDTKDVEPADPLDGFACNCVEHLDCFQQTERWLSRDAFVSEARRRISEGMRLYTCVANGVLVHFGWLVPRQEESWFPYVQQRYRFPEGTAVLFNAYTHPKARGAGLHERSMRRRAFDAAQFPGTLQIYTALESYNRTSRSVMERAGFRCVDVLFERVRFGRRVRSRMSPSEYFERVSRA